MGRDAETVRGYEGGNRGRRVGWSTTATVSSTPPPGARARIPPVFLPLSFGDVLTCLGIDACNLCMPLPLAFVLAIQRVAVTPRRSGSEMSALYYLEGVVALAPDVKCRQLRCRTCSISRTVKRLARLPRLSKLICSNQRHFCTVR